MSQPFAPPPPGAIMLHAAAVVVNGGAWLFLGPPETGKSTLCRLLESFALTLADDKVYLMKEGAEWTVADVGMYDPDRPHSAAEIAALHKVPLHHIFRLYQSPWLHLERLSALETCRHLAEAFFELYWQKMYNTQQKRAYFANLACIARTVPGHVLFFNLSPETTSWVANEIGSQL